MPPSLQTPPIETLNEASKKPTGEPSENKSELYRQAYDVMARLYDIPANLPCDDIGLRESQMEDWSQELDSILGYLYESPTDSLDDLRAKISLSFAVLQQTQSDPKEMASYKAYFLRWIDDYTKS